MSVKVLAVDDSKTIRMIVKKAFSSFDVELFEAENGAEGLTVAIREKPNLIVLDITMPVMNGVEMLSRLKADPNLKSIPVIMLTAESGKDNVLNIVKMGVANYMVKPFKGEQLIERALKVIKLNPKGEGPATGQDINKLFLKDGDIHVFKLPDKVTRGLIQDMEATLQTSIAQIAKSGSGKMICDATGAGELNVLLVKLMVLVSDLAVKHGVTLHFVGSQALANDLKGFQETSHLPVSANLDEAKSALS